MTKNFDVYIRTKEVETSVPVLVQSDPGHACSHGYGAGTLETFECKVERLPSENDKQMLEILRVVAEESGLKVNVYDLNTRTGSLRARLHNVRTTPAIMVGGKKIDGEVSQSNILRLIKTV